MSTQTTNYHLIKPALTDAADITAMNENWDTLDALLHALACGMVPITRKVNGKALSSDIELDASDVNATPIDHASSGTDYGIGNSVKYGHLKLSSDTDSSSGVDGGTAATPYAVKAVADSKAPKSHASSDTTYGKGTSSYYGHVKLSDSTSSSSGASSGGIAATPAAVKAAYDLAAGKAAAATYSVTTTTSWTATSGDAPYYQQINVPGILATDNPIVGLDLSGTAYADVADEQDAYSLIYRIETLAGKIKVYAHEAITVALTLQLKVVR